MKTIQLTQDKETIVDDDVYEWASKYKWTYCSRYAIRTKRYGLRKDNKRFIYLLHREIINAPKGIDIDHINGNGLDNRRENLRLCNASTNQMNRDKSITNTSGYKGVSWHKKRKKWQATICVSYKQIHLGYYNFKEEAVYAYNKAAIKYHKKFAKLNKI